jgi:hypothetical protein
MTPDQIPSPMKRKTRLTLQKQVIHAHSRIITVWLPPVNPPSAQSSLPPCRASPIVAESAHRTDKIRSFGSPAPAHSTVRNTEVRRSGRAGKTGVFALGFGVGVMLRVCHRDSLRWLVSSRPARLGTLRCGALLVLLHAGKEHRRALVVGRIFLRGFLCLHTGVRAALVSVLRCSPSVIRCFFTSGDLAHHGSPHRPRRVCLLQKI